MKKVLTVLALLAFSVTGWAQENMVSLNYGFEWANMQIADNQGNGWRINGVYEFNPGEGKLVHGLAFGYATVSGDYTYNDGDGLGSQQKTAKVGSWPIYYAPKLLLSSGKVKPYVKGAVGMHFSKLETTGSAGTVTANASGFYGGGGGGLMLFVKENIFINAEYEIAWLSNSYYEGGWLQSAQIGLGVKF